MALNSTALKSEMEAGIRTAMGLGATPYPELTKYCETLAQVIVDHIKNNAELNNAKFSGTYYGTVNTGTSTSETTITNQPVTGGVK